MIVISGTKPASCLGVGPDQQVADEQRMPGEFGDDARRQLLAFVGAADEVLNEQILVRRMGAEVGQQGLEMRRSHRRVVVPPHMRRVAASRTMNLSLGERPVCWPV